MPTLPCYTMPYHRIANLLGDDEADFRFMKAGTIFCLHAGENKLYRAATGANPVESTGELVCSPHTVGGWEHVTECLGSQPRAPFIATTCNNCASCASAHALTETVYLMATTVIWLKSTLYHVFSLHSTYAKYFARTLSICAVHA